MFLKGLYFLDGGSTYKNVFPVFSDFRTNRFQKTGCFQSGRILGPRGAQRHLKHGDWSSQFINSTVTLLLFIKDFRRNIYSAATIIHTENLIGIPMSSAAEGYGGGEMAAVLLLCSDIARLISSNI